MISLSMISSTSSEMGFRFGIVGLRLMFITVPSDPSSSSITTGAGAVIFFVVCCVITGELLELEVATLVVGPIASMESSPFS